MGNSIKLQTVHKAILLLIFLYLSSKAFPQKWNGSLGQQDNLEVMENTGDNNQELRSQNRECWSLPALQSFISVKP